MKTGYSTDPNDKLLFTRFKVAFPEASFEEFQAYQLYREAHPKLNAWIPDDTPGGMPTPENPAGQKHTPTNNIIG